MEEEKKQSQIERRWKKVQHHLGYTEEELAVFRSNPAQVKAIERSPAFATMQMVIEVTEVHNCAAGYKPGDRFVVDAEGFLVLDQSPPTLCVGAIYSFKCLVDRMWQAFLDSSTEVLHDTVHCPDVGVRQGGAGQIVMRIHAEPKSSDKK
jgi:uncharacterized repeat protein (TIGR04076 family)